jgi:hypothetical protein
MQLTENQWKTLLGAVAAVCGFLLTQSDVTVPPLLKVTLGAVIVALAVINPPAPARD